MHHYQTDLFSSLRLMISLPGYLAVRHGMSVMVVRSQRAVVNDVIPTCHLLTQSFHRNADRRSALYPNCTATSKFLHPAILWKKGVTTHRRAFIPRTPR